MAATVSYAGFPAVLNSMNFRDELGSLARGRVSEVDKEYWREKYETGLRRYVARPILCVTIDTSHTTSKICARPISVRTQHGGKHTFISPHQAFRRMTNLGLRAPWPFLLVPGFSAPLYVQRSENYRYRIFRKVGQLLRNWPARAM